MEFYRVITIESVDVRTHFAIDLDAVYNDISSIIADKNFLLLINLVDISLNSQLGTRVGFR